MHGEDAYGEEAYGEEAYMDEEYHDSAALDDAFLDLCALPDSVDGRLSGSVLLLKHQASGSSSGSWQDVVSEAAPSEWSAVSAAESSWEAPTDAPLPPGDLQAYTEFSQTPEGRALNAGLFAGFEALYRDISYALGLMAGQGMQGSDL